MVSISLTLRVILLSALPSVFSLDRISWSDPRRVDHAAKKVARINLAMIADCIGTTGYDVKQIVMPLVVILRTTPSQRLQVYIFQLRLLPPALVKFKQFFENETTQIHFFESSF